MTNPKQEAPRVVWIAEDYERGFLPHSPDEHAQCVHASRELATPGVRHAPNCTRYIRADLAAELARECLEFVPDGHDYQQAVAEAQLWRRVIELEGKGDE